MPALRVRIPQVFNETVKYEADMTYNAQRAMETDYRTLSQIKEGVGDVAKATEMAAVEALGVMMEQNDHLREILKEPLDESDRLQAKKTLEDTEKTVKKARDEGRQEKMAAIQTATEEYTGTDRQLRRDMKSGLKELKAVLKMLFRAKERELKGYVDSTKDLAEDWYEQSDKDFKEVRKGISNGHREYNTLRSEAERKTEQFPAQVAAAYKRLSDASTNRAPGVWAKFYSGAVKVRADQQKRLAPVFRRLAVAAAKRAAKAACLVGSNSELDRIFI